jgi:Zn-dependent peptidase ImmA (M78 family)
VANYRMSESLPVSTYAIALWLREAERAIGDVELPRYDPDGLRGLVPAIRPLSVQHVAAGAIEQARDRLASVGVGLLLVKGIRGAPASGAVRWIRNSPWILLTLRHNTDDHLWFSLFHEIGHLLEGGRRESVIEQLPDEQAPIDHVEDAANAFAREALLPNFQPEELWSTAPLNRNTIREVAAEYGVAPGIVVGRLERDGRIAPGQYRDLKRPIGSQN